MRTPRNCVVCGEIFQAWSKTSRFCGPGCRNKSGIRRSYDQAIANGLCPRCRKQNDDLSYTVCTKCRTRDKAAYIKKRERNIPCTVCGVTFVAGSANAQYCSDECRKQTPDGKCPRCKKRPSSTIKDVKLCDECHTERSAWWHSRSDDRKSVALHNARAWRERNPDYYHGPNGMNTRSNFKIKVEIFNHYGPNCECCGESNLIFLNIDHIDGNGNNHRREVFGVQSGGGTRFYRWLKRQDFPDGYRVLCFNCNFGAARCGGTCPHKLDQG